VRPEGSAPLLSGATDLSSDYGDIGDSPISRILNQFINRKVLLSQSALIRGKNLLLVHGSLFLPGQNIINHFKELFRIIWRSVKVAGHTVLLQAVQETE
jgi:hypothetical protein